MADWDPFAIDDSAASAPAPPGTNGVASSKKAGGVSKTELDSIADMVYKHLKTLRPWSKIIDPNADLTWYHPSCSLEDWKHDQVKIEVGQGIAYVIFNRPNTNNELDAGIYAALADAMVCLHSRKDLRCVVFSGEGKMFSGGTDPKFDGNFVRHAQPARVERSLAQLKERAARAGATPDLGRLLQAKLWYTLALLPQFTIALVNGSAIGDAVGALACMDMVISVKSAYFSLPEVRSGLVQCGLAPYIVAKVGAGMAKYMLGSGRAFSVEEMRRAGLISEVVETVQEGHQKIAEICEVLTGCGPRSVEASKQLIFGVGGQPITERVMFFTAAMLAKVTVSDESKDGMVCVQMRKPKPWEEKPITPLH
uniref:3-hydroxyisobutyryl-coenzyme A hydrolase n=1 Tax=Zooxanthella nutricula TaxID=1333877 RepID=A0A7S2LWI6_9DINO